MMANGDNCTSKQGHAGSSNTRPKYDVAQIFRRYLGEYEKKYKLSYEQRCAVNNILACRTAEKGGYIKVCDRCGKTEIAYIPCKDRHCTKCGSFEKAQWLEEQKRWLLPIHYYHVIFTIDHVFNPLVWRNKKKLYNLLCRIAAQVLQEYGDRYMGGQIGFTLVLHTWGQTIQAHPHVHTMVTGGALTKTNSGYKWKEGKETYMLPATEFSADFRMSFCTAIRKMWKTGQLDTQDGQLNVEAMLEEAESKGWEVFIQTPNGEVRNLLDYLGRYVFRIAISNHRILKVARGLVTFEYYDNRDDGKLKIMTLSAVEFIRRFLLHVLPKHFQRIRHYGLHHSSQQQKLLIARQLLGLSAEKPKIEFLKMAEWLKEILQEDPDICPFCGQGKMILLREFGPTEKWRLMFAPLVAKLYSWSPAY
jgi:hypothetical protein